MLRRMNTYSICIAFGLSLLLFFAGSRYADDAYYNTSLVRQRNIKIVLKVEDGEETYTQQIPIILHDGSLNDSPGINNKPITPYKAPRGPPNITNNTGLSYDDSHISLEIEKLLDKTRSKIKHQLSEYNFSQSGVNGLEDLVIEAGGQPLRSLIISTWRSGSTFFGELINAVPATYYHNEPLIMYGTKQIRRQSEAYEALRMVKNMFKCDFVGLEEYFDFGRKDKDQFGHNTRLWDHCKYENKKDLCYDDKFVSRVCKLFPFQTMKLTRLRLRLVKEIMEDKDLNVKVILLVRDPRGVMQSRGHRHFCEIAPDCWEPSLVCADMVSDYEAAGKLMQQYPDRIMVLRFEDLALNPNMVVEQIPKFLKIDAKVALDEFLQSHTNVNIAGMHSTFRVSRDIPLKWTKTLYFNYVDEIQSACKEAMRLWGYEMAYNETHMRSNDFNPIQEYKITS